MATLVSHGQPGTHPDYKLVKRLEEAIYQQAGGFASFREEIPLLLRKAIDEVIDAPRTNRFTLEEIEKTEKTYLGTKVEILLRNHLKLPRGKILDLLIDGIEVDVKNTMGSSWMIPSEAMGHPCILVITNEKKALFSFGIIVIRQPVLTSGKNKDGKGQISAAGKEQIHWLLRDEPYPKNFWQDLEPTIRAEITAQSSPNKRVATLFRLVQGMPISRVQILGLAQQEDPMRRLRKNGGARDSLSRQGIAILSGQYDRELIEALNLPTCGRNEFISFTPVNQEDKEILREKGLVK